MSQANSPVKVKKFLIDTKSNAEDLLMGHDVTIDHFSAIDFDKVKLPTTMNLLPSNTTECRSVNSHAIIVINASFYCCC